MIGYECNLVYIDFFDIDIPSIDIFYKKDSIVYLSVPNNIYNAGLSTINNDDLNALGNSIMVSSQPNSSGENTLINFLNGCGATMGFIGSSIGILAAFWASLTTFKDILLFYISFNLLCGAFSCFTIALVKCFAGNAIGGMIAGIGTGLMISALFGLFLATELMILQGNQL